MKVVALLLTSFFSISSFASQTWIHLQQADNLPIIRSGDSPFEVYDTNFDPNTTYTSPLYRFVPVTYVDQPQANSCKSQDRDYNPILINFIKTETVGVDGTYEGRYAEPDGWVVDWESATQALKTAKNIQYDCLQTDYNTAIAEGWTPGAGYEFRYEPETFNLISGQYYALEHCIVEGGSVGPRVCTPTEKITFSDANGKEAQVNITQLGQYYLDYWSTWQLIKEKEVRATDQIATAQTVEEVDAVTWNF